MTCHPLPCAVWNFLRSSNLWVREIFFFHPWFSKYNHGERIGNTKENFPSKKEKMGNNIFNIPWHKTYTAVQKKARIPLSLKWSKSFRSDRGYSRSCCLGQSSLSMVLRGYTRGQCPFQAMHHLSRPVETCQVWGRLVRGVKRAVTGEGEQMVEG